MISDVDGRPIATVGAELSDAQALFVHATGFCKETLLPVADALEPVLGSNRSLLIDQRGHGDSTPHDGPFDWDSLARDVLRVRDAIGSPIIGVGHSSGGAAIARGEILEPGSFAQLVLIEPIAFPGPYSVKEIPLSVGAERRRRSFASREAAWSRFRSGPFADWDERALALYVDSAFEQTSDGWTLKCHPSTEAEYYRQASNVDTWDRLDEIRCPVTVISGEHSTSHVDPFLSMLLARFSEAESVVLAGLGHLAPMQDPDRVAGVIRAAVEGHSTLPTID